ncbi:hypothetical protein SMD44_p10155 (plasmid) [Streptomyces alboflavus]|uniref:Uncharacterized protein n=1 Tax=Streptomyces alboflavus TaxID=67267 RepID=A0A291W3T2_9ACTN|nr:hypothetical protein [Streptomyces alboflavus]ATM24654.1 hypothetical protein SMD44_p10155 [Streptomyces alboflavus]
MTVTMPDVRERDRRDLVVQLRDEVRVVLAKRAEALQAALPPRPGDAHGRYAWLRSLDEPQARRAELLNRLEALCGHLSGRPALGIRADDALPAAALEEADGFLSESAARLVAAYRRIAEGPSVVSGAK